MCDRVVTLHRCTSTDKSIIKYIITIKKLICFVNQYSTNQQLSHSTKQQHVRYCECDSKYHSQLTSLWVSWRQRQVTDEYHRLCSQNCRSLFTLTAQQHHHQKMCIFFVRHHCHRRAKGHAFPKLFLDKTEPSSCLCHLLPSPRPTTVTFR